MKTVLIIAGSDPGAGAGLQQDLKVATLMGAYGLTVVTALTVQNSLGVTAVHPVAPEVVAAQLDAVLSDFPVAAVKVGMLATPALVRTVAEKLKGLNAAPGAGPGAGRGRRLPAAGGSRDSSSERRAVPPDQSPHPQRPGGRPSHGPCSPDPR